MNQTQKAIAEIIKTEKDSLMTGDFDGSRALRRVANKFADLFEREDKERLSNPTRLKLIKAKQPVMLLSPFDRKEFLKACGVQ